MRVVLVPSAFAPAVGGVEEVTARLATELRERGDDVEVWTIRHPPSLPPDSAIDGLRVRRFPMPLPSARPAQVVQWPPSAFAGWRSISGAVSDFRPDVVHVHCFSANGVYAAAVARRRGIPLAITLHGETVTDDNNIYKESLVLRMGLRFGLRQASAVTAPSSFVLSAAERFGLPTGVGEVIVNGVDLAEGDRHERVNVPFRRFILGLGRLVWNKGFDVLLDAFALVAARHPEVGLMIGGEGPERVRLEQRAEDLGLTTRVIFPGILTREQVSWAMANAALFALSSRIESFGVVVLEAMRAGCPVVACRSGGVPELLGEGRHGVLVDGKDPRALAEGIRRIIEGDALAAELRAAGRRRVTDFDWKLVAEHYRQLYRRIL